MEEQGWQTLLMLTLRHRRTLFWWQRMQLEHSFIKSLLLNELELAYEVSPDHNIWMM